MAESQACSICTKRLGVTFCMGCKAHFCHKDYQTHRQEMNHELDKAMLDCNDLQDKINLIIPVKDSDSLIHTQIDDWEKSAIIKIHEVAERARQESNKMYNTKKADTIARYNEFVKKFIEMKEEQDFIEQHVEQAKQTIHQIRQDLIQLAEPSLLQLNLEQSNNTAWNRLIYVQKNFDYDTEQINFEEKRASIVTQVDSTEKRAPTMKGKGTEEKLVSILKSTDDKSETIYPTNRMQQDNNQGTVR